MKLRSIFIISLILSLFVVVRPAATFAADANVGNEVVDAFNTTLTRTGAGTAANPYKLQLNVGNANTWTGIQTFSAAATFSGTLASNNSATFNSTLNANGILNLGDGGDSATISGTTVGIATADNNANAFLLQQGTIKYLQVKTTNGAENISFGNTTTNPTYSFLGSGATTFSGPLTTNTLTATSLINTTSVLTTSINTNSLTATGSSYLNGIVNASGLITANGGLTVSSGQTLTANGASLFSPNGTNDVIFSTDSDSTIVINGLATASGTALCVDGSSNLVLCSAGGGSGTLQDGYNSGNTISSTNARDISYTLSDTATDSNFTVETASGATGYTSFNLQDGAGVSTPSQLVAINNLDNDSSIPVGLKVQSEAGGVTTAVDASDADIVTALSSGSNDLNGTNWSITGSTGNVQTSGDVTVSGGDITTTSTTFNLVNNNATTVNIAGAATNMTLGATFGTATLRGTTVNLPNATMVIASGADGTFGSATLGGGYGSTGVTVSSSGNISSNGNLTVDGTSSLTGNVTASSDIAVNGGDLTSTSSTFNLVNSNATTVNIAGAATSLNLGAGFGTTSINNNLTANGGMTVVSGQTLSANGSSSFSPSSTDDVTVNTDSDSTLVLTGLQTATGDGLCIDSSDNVIKCSGTPSDRRLKKNISNLSEVLPKVLQAQGVRYDLLKEEESAPGKGKNIGFIAQDLEVLFPEVVKTDANGIKSVDYEKMTAVLVESTKEQQKQIDALKAEVEELKALIKEK